MAHWAIATRTLATLLLVAASPATAFLTEPRHAAGPAPGREGPSAAVAVDAPPSVAAVAVDAPPSLEAPPFVVHPLLARAYPALVAHRAAYGNPNIPLGNPDGRRCYALRRLHFQGKLSDEEAAHLEDMGFRFHSFEDVYYECDFDEMLGRLMEYREREGTFQIPKKYKPDPELGAWVTMLRRLKRTDDLPLERIERMDEVKFEWVSTRKCGGLFMTKYREALTLLSGAVEARADVRELLENNPEIRKWIDAQRLAHENGNLSAQRADYMDDLPGIDWKNPDGARPEVYWEIL